MPALSAHPIPQTSSRVLSESASGSPDLPRWRSVLAVVAHPDDEAIGLGAVLDLFAARGSEVSVLCLTPGESYSPSPVSGDLLPLRRSELAAAAKVLGIAHAHMHDYSVGHLEAVPTQTLVDEVMLAVDTWRPEGLVVFDVDGVNGKPDHRAATRAALGAAARRGLSVLGWGIPAEVAEILNDELGLPTFSATKDTFAVPVCRERQRMATLVYAHESSPSTLVWRRLELLGDVEHLRWLRREPVDQTTMQVTYDTGDRFAIDVRGHRIVVDQPPAIGGDDLGPTPTELFVASLASCVAFYARRYLNRHRLDATGLTVEVGYRMATKPSRVGGVDLRIVVPEGVPEERRAGLLAQAGHCTVHTSITTPPDIAITLA